jgi:hypothetical protein
MRVDPVIARLESLTQKPVRGSDGKHFDHLEITALLNVVRPGDYEFLAGIGNPGPFSPGAFTSENKKLSAGRHIWTVSIRAAKLRRGLKDGPVEIGPVHISSLEVGLMRYVDTSKIVLRSVFKSSEWMDASTNPSSP